MGAGLFLFQGTKKPALFGPVSCLSVYATLAYPMIAFRVALGRITAAALAGSVW